MAPAPSPLTFASLCTDRKAGCSEHRLTQSLCLLLHEFRPREAGGVPPDPSLGRLGPCSVCFLRAEPEGTESTAGRGASLSSQTPSVAERILDCPHDSNWEPAWVAPASS